eukprot:TRINITY_DN25889_c0_g1_i1.p1 TRINITY_DN25889_c0_g1~~TRINITY_DN25889_c0_g1_i1.p1  ORF type:complete len:111 (-),score=20.13 TRINITY_DN25889_c0_g1_i1:152-484(-)
MLRSLVGSEMCIRDRVRDMGPTRGGLPVVRTLGLLGIGGGACGDLEWVPSSRWEAWAASCDPSKSYQWDLVRFLVNISLLPLEWVAEGVLVGRCGPVSYTHLTLPTKRIV